MATPLPNILQWWKRYAKPTAEQIAETFRSFRHKNDKIPAADVEGMDALLQQKADKIPFEAHRDDTVKHITGLERIAWNNKLGAEDLPENLLQYDPVGSEEKYFNEKGEAVRLSDIFLTADQLKLINASNLVIGGVGATINTKALLAQKFNFSENDIANFLVVNNNVYATITKENYVLNGSAFRNNTDITSFEEKDGFLTNLGFYGFENATSLEYLKVRCKELTVVTHCFNGCVKLSPSKLILDECEKINAAQFLFSALKADGTILRLPKLKEITSSCSRWFGAQNQSMSIDFPALKILSGNIFSYAYDLIEVNLPSLEICGATVDEIGGAFQVGDGVFNGVRFTPNSSQTETKFYINRKLQTVNNGEPDTDIRYLINLSIANVVWVGQNPYLKLEDENGNELVVLDMPTTLKVKNGTYDPNTNTLTIT